MRSLSDKDRADLRTLYIALLIVLVGALLFGIYGHPSGRMDAKTNTLLFVGGVIGLGASAFSLTGGFGDIGRASRVLNVVNLCLAGVVFAMCDLSAILHGGLRVTTPFVVVIVMAVLGLIRRR